MLKGDWYMSNGKEPSLHHPELSRNPVFDPVLLSLLPTSLAQCSFLVFLFSSKIGQEYQIPTSLLKKNQKNKTKQKTAEDSSGIPEIVRHERKESGPIRIKFPNMENMNMRG
jgi:hypothetical protein